jgi:hypothetical protein
MSAKIGSYDKGSDKAAIHMVNAWAVHNRLVLGQVKTNAKSNEITVRYFISSLTNNIERFAKAVRGHWGVENSLHWGGSALRGFPPL